MGELMKSALIELQFLPPISYFSLLCQYDEIVLERHEHYVKQSYRNRCYINTASGREMLVVPLTAKHGKVPITEIKIDYQQKWVNRTWRTLQSSYGKAPYFDFYAEGVHAILFQKFTFLYDLNYQLLSLCLNWLKWNIPIKESNQFQKSTLPPLYDLRNVMDDKNEHHKSNYYHPVVYTQVFGNKFVQDLSVLDLIFCLGPASMSHIQQSTKTDEHFDFGKR